MAVETGSGAATLRSELFRRYPDEAARVLDVRPLSDVAEVLQADDPRSAAEVLARLEPATSSRVVTALEPGARARVLARMDPVRAAPMLARLDEEARRACIEGLDERTSAELIAMMQFPPDSAGSLMDPRVTAFRSETTVGDALERLRARGERDFDEILLLDGDGRVIGLVALEDLALASPVRRLADLPSQRPYSVQATSSVAEVLELPSEARPTSVAVVDFDERLLGVIRPAGLAAAVEEKATTDLQAMVGGSRDERALSPVTFAVKRRLPWLYVNLVTAFVAAAVVGVFESTIARITALAVLLPVVAGQSGNSGAQALAVTMRGLALREVRPKHWRRLAFKEAAVGFANGIAIAVVTALGVIVWSGSAGLGMVIGIAMVISMAIAGTAGASVPIVLKVVGQDPAQASSIVLTTVTDVVGFLSFLGLATLLADRIAL